MQKRLNNKLKNLYRKLKRDENLYERIFQIQFCYKITKDFNNFMNMFYIKIPEELKVLKRS